MKKICLSALFIISCLVIFGQKNFLLVGTYTGGKSEGIYIYHFDSNTGDFDSASMIKTNNPSFLAVTPNEKFVYAVNEAANKGNGGKVSAFAFNKDDGRLSFINQQFSDGDDPCYVSVDKTGKWIAVANYSSGNLSVFPIHKDGTLDSATTVIQHTGRGEDKERQEGPHVHCTIFSKDNKYLFATDLGLDKVTVYSFNKRKGKLTEKTTGSIKTDLGAGPRHITFHPNNKYAYLIQELKGIISVYHYSNGKLEWRQNISALPAGYKGAIGSADIHVSPDGNFLYASNRDASNTIAIFRIDQNTGLLTLVGHQPTLGRTPRNFNFDPSGNFLLVANQNNDEIVIFKVDKSTGLLTDSGKRIKVGKPVCIKWISE
ncbi:MAG TPA: lactonase family protein [Chitinophagaceae bacterium]|nr:lactonase family protein [Chitinophagaceae bacterium]